MRLAFVLVQGYLATGTMTSHGRRTAWLAGALAALVVFASAPSRSLLAQNPEDPLLILISFDGFRWDYLGKAPAPALQRLIVRGVRAEGLIPSYPTKTFPNHHTIVTGLAPEHHGIVANDIRDPSTGRTFGMSRSEARESMWWGGEPLWVTAERRGRRAGTMFWPGSEAAIGGVRPTYWKPYLKSTSGAARVDQVLAWLDLPPAKRPAFLTLYFEDADTAGHVHGPDSNAVRRAIGHLDGYVARLVRGLEQRGLADRANIVVVSDHGLAATVSGQVIELDDYISLSDVDVVDINPTLGLFPAPGRTEAVYRGLVRAHPHLHVYRRSDTPDAWRYRQHQRIPPIVGVVDEGWQVVRGTLMDRVVRAVTRRRGIHGYDPSVPSMRGILIAAGPAFKQGVTVPAMENIHVYNALATALGVTPAPNDGDIAVARRLLR
jgi:predicted AlkP superfamily pyrophosphatase or phosphodiesterase